MLSLAKESQDGQLYTCLSCMVLSAFMLEAYFNHLGQLKHANWESIERKLSKAKKFANLATAAGLAPAMNDRPYSSLVRVFAFRDAMAHARTMKDEIDIEVQLSDSLAKSLPGPEWQELITIENAEQILEDAVSIVRELHKAAGYGDDPFGTSGSGIYVASRGEK